MFLLWLAPYLVVCIAAARWVGRRFASAWAGWTATALIAATLLVVPLADEIVGYFEFARLCEQARDVKVHATIPVGEELYTPQGKWRIGLAEGDFDERFKARVRAERALDSYVRAENRALPPAKSTIDIRGREIRMFDAKTGSPLAEWRQFSTAGGWVSRHFEKPLLVPSQCAPRAVVERTVAQTVLPFGGPAKP